METRITVTEKLMGHPTASQIHNAVVNGIEKILERLDEIEEKLEKLKDKKDENLFTKMLRQERVLSLG